MISPQSSNQHPETSVGSLVDSRIPITSGLDAKEPIF